MLPFEESVHRRDAEDAEKSQERKHYNLREQPASLSASPMNSISRLTLRSLRLCGERIRFERARPEDSGKLATLLWENGMGYAEPIEDFMLAWQDDEIVGCGRIEDYPEVAMVRPLVVAKAFRNRGIGRLLLERILPAGKPTVIVARGESTSFYSAFGFTIADWEAIPIHQAHECTSCPERADCRPQPMVYRR